MAKSTRSRPALEIMTLSGSIQLPVYNRKEMSCSKNSRLAQIKERLHRCGFSGGLLQQCAVREELDEAGLRRGRASAVSTDASQQEARSKVRSRPGPFCVGSLLALLLPPTVQTHAHLANW